MEVPWIDKVEVARRQVIVGVRLFFEGADPVAVHTIIAAAHQILSDLAAKNGTSSLIKNPRLKNAEIYQINYPFNFMKHADRDPEGKIDIAPLEEFTNDFIMDTVFMLQTVSGSIPIEGKVYWHWFVSKFPDGFDNLPSDSEIKRMQSLELAKWDFPRIRQFLKFADIVGDGIPDLQKSETEKT